MSVLRFSARLTLALVCVLSVSRAIAAEPTIEGFGLRAEAVYWFGDRHLTQERWAANFAIANSAQLIRYANPIINRHRSHIDELDYEPAMAAFQDRSPFAVQFNFTALGDHTTMLWGVPVAAKISPVHSANGQEGSSWLANPWVWVGAVVVGAAASGGGGGSSSGDGVSGGGTNVNIVSGNRGEDCISGDNTIDPDNPTDGTYVEVDCGTGL